MANVIPSTAFQTLMGGIGSGLSGLGNIFMPPSAPASASLYEQARAQAQRNAMARFGMGLMSAGLKQTIPQRNQALQNAFGAFNNLSEDSIKNAQMLAAEKQYEAEEKARQSKIASLKSLLGLDGAASKAMLPTSTPIRDGGFAAGGGVSPTTSMAPAYQQGPAYQFLSPAQRALVKTQMSAGDPTGAFDTMTGFIREAAKPKDAFTLGKDQDRYEYNVNTGEYEKVAGETSVSTAEPLTASEQLAARKAITSSPAYAAYVDLSQKAQSLSKVIDKDDRVVDLEFVYAAANALDPGSVVRENEQLIVQRTQGAAGQIVGLINSIYGGQGLDKATRENLYSIIQRKANGYRNAALDDIDALQQTDPRYRMIKFPSMPEVGLPGVISVREIPNG